MKIRSGFVSNSSSSSFAIIGEYCCLTEQNFVEFAKRYKIKIEDKGYVWDQWNDVISELEKEISEFGLIIAAPDRENNSFYIGIEPEVSETKKKEVANKINKLAKSNPLFEKTTARRVEFEYGEYSY